ncbi:Branched-chain amino acid transport protein (AzlD) [compost metagenome]
MIMLIIIGMGVITMLLRFLPLIVTTKSNNGLQMHPFLERLPLAVLSAITVPGVFQVDDSNPLVGIAACVVAVLLVLVKKVPLFLVVVLSVAAAVLVKML